MSVLFVCDGCGKQEKTRGTRAGYFAPHAWYRRTDKETGITFDACSRDCVEAINEQNGDRTPILPF